jgi:hypothetical protein
MQDDELREEHLESGEGMAGSGKEKQIFYIGKSLVLVGVTNRD